MGCDSSSAINPVDNNDSSDDGKKRSLVQGLNKGHLQQIIDEIEDDDVQTFAILMEKYGIPLNAELSEKGLYWMGIHFCCRFNSSKVLEYILKSFYLEKPMQYIEYVNQTTSQGETCLHLCAIWDSFECMNILLKYGGLYLVIKDKNDLMPLDVAISHRRAKIRARLEGYSKRGEKLIQVEYEKLLEEDEEDGKDKQKVQKQKQIEKLQQIAMGGIVNEIELKKQQLLAQKQKLEEETKNMRLEMKKVEEQQAIQQQQIKKSKQQIPQQGQLSNGGGQLSQKQLLKTQTILQKQINQQTTKLESYKKELKHLQEKKAQQMLEQEQKKSLLFIQQNQKRIKQQSQLKKSQIQQQLNKYEEQNKDQSSMQRAIRRKQQKKEKQRQEAAQANSQVESQISGSLPSDQPQIRQLYQAAKSKGQFTDPEFPHVNQSIGNNNKAQTLISKHGIVWLRPSEFFKGRYELFDGIDPNDIKQGSLGVCYMLATLSTLAQKPQRIKQMFVFSDKKIGFYLLRVLINGEIRYISVDDAIPCNQSTKSPVFAKPVGNELWVCLVEKLWAKCIGNYTKAEQMTPNYLMQDLTMGPSFGEWFKDQTLKTKQIDEHIKLNHIVVLSSQNEKKIQGIANNHAYSLLDVYEHNGLNIYKIRNPWGRFEWNGEYGDNSDKMTEELKKKLNFIDADDGIFFLSETELLEIFTYYSICIVREDNCYNSVKVKTKHFETKYYTFQLSEAQQINIRFIQKFDRMLSDSEKKEYKYSPVLLEVGRIEEDGSVTFLTEGSDECVWGAKSVNADREMIKRYQKGKYFIRLAVLWELEEKHNTGVLSVYSPEKVTINELIQEEGEKYWIELLKDHMVKNNNTKPMGKVKYDCKWLRGQMILYSYVNEEEEGELFEVKWVFKPQKFDKCSMGMNRSLEEKGAFVFQQKKGKENATVATITRQSPNKSCHAGSFMIKTTKIE